VMNCGSSQPMGRKLEGGSRGSAHNGRTMNRQNTGKRRARSSDQSLTSPQSRAHHRRFLRRFSRGLEQIRRGQRASEDGNKSDGFYAAGVG
jgi:hypothetical protein